jgi:SEFIR domain-containing protein/carboxypeptidase family protein
MAPSPPRIFISYSHDSTEHKELVLRFAQRLRKDGVDAQIDQFVGGRPREGWPRWMLNKLDWAEFVLLICTEAYYRRFRGHEEPGTGKGVDWEGQIITLEIYNAKSHTTKFVPVIFGSQDREFIPEPLCDHVYCLDSEGSYQELYGFLTGQAGVSLPALGAVKELPRKDVGPLTFGGHGKTFPAANQPHKAPGSPPAKHASGVGSTSRGNGGFPPYNEDTLDRQRRKEIALYALISLISFLSGVGVLGLMIWKADLLARLGLTGNFFYIVLLPMGLAAAGFLFGVVHSYARYSGKNLGGMLELGGPIVAFLLVVILGFVLVKPVTTFPLTVYVHGEGGPQDLVLRNSGDVLLDLGGDRRRQPIGAEGQAYFPAIPPTFRGQEVPIGVECATFELTDPKQKCRLDGSSIYLSVQRKAGHLSGWVKDEKGNPVPGATVNIAGLSKVTDSAGYFEFAIPGHQMQGELQLEALAPGYAPVNLNSVVPGGNPLTIQLQRTP